MSRYRAVNAGRRPREAPPGRRRALLGHAAGRRLLAGATERRRGRRVFRYLGHSFRSDPDGALLRSIPSASILGVQLCDAPAAVESEALHATLHERLLPGDGELALPTLLADLRATGTAAPIGVEVSSDALHALSPEEAGRRAGAALRRVLGTG